MAPTNMQSANPSHETTYDGFEMHGADEAQRAPSKEILATSGGKFSNAMAKMGGQVNVNGADFWKQWASAGGDKKRGCSTI